MDEYHRTGDLDAVRQKLNHDPAHAATTLLYALADKLDDKALRALGKQK